MAKKSVADYPHLAEKFKGGQKFPWASSHTPENGKTHWDIGLPGSICGNHEPGRKIETMNKAKVDCPDCIRILRTRP